MPHFFMFEFFEMPHFSYLILKMKFFDFGAFQKNEKMLSHDKILFHMIFGAFHDTSCIRIHKIDENNLPSSKVGFEIDTYHEIIENKRNHSKLYQCLCVISKLSWAK